MPSKARKKKAAERAARDTGPQPAADPPKGPYGHQNVYKYCDPGTVFPLWHEFDWVIQEHAYEFSSEEKKREIHERAKNYGLPRVIRVALDFDSKMACVAELTAYTKFKNAMAMQTFSDTVCADIIGKTGKLMHNQFVHGDPADAGAHEKGKSSAPKPCTIPSWVVSKAQVVENHMPEWLAQGYHYVTVGGVAANPGVNDASKVHPTATIALAAFRLLHLAPVAPLGPDEEATFDAEYDRRYTQESEGGPWLGYSPEDFYRCVAQVYYFVARRRARHSIMNPTGPRPAAVAVPMIDPDYRPAIATSVSNPFNELARRSNTISQMFRDRSQMGFGTQTTTTTTTTPTPASSAVGVLTRLARREALVNKMTKDPKHKGRTLGAVLAAKNKRQGTALPPITRDAINDLLSALEGELTVETSDLKSDVAHALVDEDTMREFVSQACSAAGAIAGARESAKGRIDEDKIRDTFARMSALSTMGSGAGELEAAVEAAGMSDWRDLVVDPNNPGFKLLPHQLVDAHWMLKMEQSDARGCILANEVGVGKTFIYLTLVLLDAMRQEKEAAASDNPGEHSYYPTVIVVPNNILGQTFDQCGRMGSQLAVKVYYETSHSVTDASRKHHIVNPNDFGNMIDRMYLDRHDPQTARTVILTSYRTIGSRLVVKERLPFEWLEGYAPTPGAATNPNAADKEYDEKTVLSDRIRLLGPNEPNPDQLYLIRYKLKTFPSSRARTDADGEPSRTQRLHFRRVIMDEAHLARNERTLIANWLRLESFAYVDFVTASPFMNSPRDYAVYLEIAFKGELEALFDGVARPDNLIDIYRADYDPVAQGGIFHDAANGKGTSRLVRFVAERDWGASFPVWVLHPVWFVTLGKEMLWDDEFSTVVLARIVSVFQRKRTMTTPLQLPDGEGTVVFPGASIPPSRIMMEELGYVGAAAERVAAFSAGVKDYALGSDSEAVIDASPLGLKTVPDKAIIQYSNYRQGSLGAFNARNIQMLASDADGLTNVDAEGVETLEIDADGPLPRGTAPSGLFACSGGKKGPIMGVKELDTLIEADTDGGLSHWYRLTQPDRFATPPTNRFDMALTSIGYSPILIRIFQLCVEWVLVEKRRVFIMADIPLAQQQIVANLTNLGFNVVSLRSSMSQSERDDVVREFNDRDEAIDVLVSGYALSSFGMNLQHACSRAILAQMHFNASTMLQATGRIRRLGQEEPVDIRILKVRRSFMEYQEQRLTRKYASELLASAAIPGALVGIGARRVVAYEMVREMLGQPFNRFA